MNQSLVITAIGEDRPGIVNALTEVLHKASLNIEDSRMSILGGEFAIILMVTGDQASINAILQQQEELQSSLHLNLLIKPTSGISRQEGMNRYSIKVEGMDNPGIVHTLTRYLSQHKINIINMQTDSSHAAHTGTPIFTVNMQVDIPSNMDISQFQTEFTELCNELSMDMAFNPA